MPLARSRKKALCGFGGQVAQDVLYVRNGFHVSILAMELLKLGRIVGEAQRFRLGEDILCSGVERGRVAALDPKRNDFVPKRPPTRGELGVRGDGRDHAGHLVSHREGKDARVSARLETLVIDGVHAGGPYLDCDLTGFWAWPTRRSASPGLPGRRTLLPTIGTPRFPPVQLPLKPPESAWPEDNVSWSLPLDIGHRLIDRIDHFVKTPRHPQSRQSRTVSERPRAPGYFTGSIRWRLEECNECLKGGGVLEKNP
jgi:hypothetical protein